MPGFNKSDDRPMHKAVCKKCHKECEVPFKPEPDRPVYCKDCYREMKDKERKGQAA